MVSCMVRVAWCVEASDSGFWCDSSDVRQRAEGRRV